MTNTFMNFLIDAFHFVCDLPEDNRAGFVNKLALSDLVIIDSFLKNHKDLPYTSEPHKVTGVSIKTNILLNVNRPINSVAGKKMMIKRVGDRLTFTAIQTTEPPVSINSTISSPPTERPTWQVKPAIMVGRQRRFHLPERAEAATSGPPLTTYK